MESLKLNFDTEIFGSPRTLVVEVPYQGGIVATSEYCPTELLAGSVDLMAAIRGESLDKFMEDCRRQLFAISNITAGEAENELEVHIGGLMAVIMDHLSQHKSISFGNLLIYIDCFSHLLKASGIADDEIRKIYSQISKSIVELYPEYIIGVQNISNQD